MSFEVLEKVYDAAITPGRWRLALDAIAEHCAADAAALVIRSNDPNIRDKTMLSSILLSFSRSPTGIYYGLALDRHQKGDWDIVKRQMLHSPRPDTALVDTAIELDNRSDYRYLRRNLGLRRRLAVRLNREPVWFDAMSLAFNARHNHVPNSSITKLMPLLPHITKAVEIGRMFNQLRTKNRSALAALDRVKVGIAVADQRGKILIKNAEADRILAEHGGLILSNDGNLNCYQHTQNRELIAELAAMAESSKFSGKKCEYSMVANRQHDDHPLLLELAPMSQNNVEVIGGTQGVLITIIDPERVPIVRIERFAKLYQMTTAEADVCSFIVQGKSIKEISENRNTTPTTAKNQVAAILSKTQTKTRLELIQLLVRILPPIE